MNDINCYISDADDSKETNRHSDSNVRTYLINGLFQLLLDLVEVIALVLLGGKIRLSLLEQFLEVPLVLLDASDVLVLANHLLVERPDLVVLVLLLLLRLLQVQFEGFDVLLQVLTRILELLIGRLELLGSALLLGEALLELLHLLLEVALLVDELRDPFFRVREIVLFRLELEEEV